MWPLLGITPTRDVRAIKRAYAARLKHTRPDDDAQAFQQLRQAYDEALRQAAEGRVDEDEAPPDAGPWAATPAPVEAVAEPDASNTDPEEPPAPLLQPANDAAAGHAAVQRLIASAPQGDDQAVLDQFQRQLAEMWRQPQWQHPSASRTLEDAWLHALQWSAPSLDNEDNTGLDGSALAECLTPREWLWLMELVADHHGWLAGRSRAAQGLGPLLHHRLVQASVQALWAIASRQGGLPVAQAQLRAQLQRPLWQGLVAQQALQQAWAAWLHSVFTSKGPRPPAAVPVLDLIVRQFEWHDNPQAWRTGDGAETIRSLLDVWTLQQDEHLLQRLASGEATHPAIPQAAAVALLQPRVRREDRKAVRQASRERRDQRSWQVQVRAAIAWLDQHCPAALQAVNPQVLRWWRAEHIQANDTWNILPIPGWIAGAWMAADAARSQWDWHGWALLLPVLAGMALGITLGFQASALLAWLRLRWRVGPYRQWVGLDQTLAMALARRWPGAGAALLGSGAGLTRDVLPAAAVLAWQFNSLRTHEMASPAWQSLLVACVPTLVFMIAWSGGLRLLARPLKDPPRPGDDIKS